jgi:uncharacterized membrane protein YGL010W
MIDWIVAIIVFGSFLAIFSKAFEGFGEKYDISMKKILLFVPYLIAGIVLYVLRELKSNTLGMIVVLLVVAFIGYGMYMGYQAGPTSPAPWE